MRGQGWVYMQEYRLHNHAIQRFRGWVNMQERWVRLRRNLQTGSAKIHLVYNSIHHLSDRI